MFEPPQTPMKKVLIVDDIPDNIDIIRKFLKSEGYQIFVATSGEKALEIVPVIMPDLVLLDVMMTGIDGFETCQQLKAAKETQHVPIIFVTAAKKDTIITGFQVGGVDFIGKPIQREELVARVKLHLHVQFLQKQQREQLLKAEKMAAIGELVAGFTHEISTPIGLGITAISHLKEETTTLLQNYHKKQMTKHAFEDYTAECGEISQIVWENLQRTVELISSFKQISIDQSSEVKRLFRVKPYVEQVILSLRPKLKHTPHQVTITGDDEVQVNSYPGYLAQIISNLVMNSLIHAFRQGDKGHLTIDIEQDEHDFILRYGDDGKGIPAEHINQIFEKYFTTKMGEGGSGLGLHIVHELVTEKMRGEITCVSEHGAQFQIVLPLT